MPAETTHAQRPQQAAAGARTHQILVIHDDGTYRRIDAAEEPLTLEVTQGLVDGLIERVTTRSFDLWVNEEGLLRDFDVNVAASWLLAKNGAPGHMIVGPAFVAVARGEESYPVRTEQVQQIVDFIEPLGWENQHEQIPIAEGSGEAIPRFAACHPILEYFQDLDPNQVRQSMGGYYINHDPTPPCCFGAHVAYLLQTQLIDSGKSAHHGYIDGWEELCLLLDVDAVALNRLLYAAGASLTPFGEEPWPVPPRQVLANLLTIEEIPTVEQANAMHDCNVMTFGAEYGITKPIAGGSDAPEAPFFQCWPIAEYFAALPESQWDQTAGNYYIHDTGHDESPGTCCVGGHLAYLLKAKLYDEGTIIAHFEHIDGVGALSTKLGIKDWQLEHLVYAAGAPSVPFGSRQWHIPPSAVFARLLRIEEVPLFDEAERMHLESIMEYAKSLFPITDPDQLNPDLIYELSAEIHDRWYECTTCYLHDQARIAWEKENSCGYYCCPFDYNLWLEHLIAEEPHKEPNLAAIPQIAGGSIEASCIGRERCIVQKEHEWCWAHEPACHAAFCHCEQSTLATEEAYEEQLRELEARQPTLPIAGGSGEQPPYHCEELKERERELWHWTTRELENHCVDMGIPTSLGHLQIPIDPCYVAHGEQLLKDGVQILTPIAGGSGEEEPIPFVAPTDSDDEMLLLHEYTVDTTDELLSERCWGVEAPSEEAIKDWKNRTDVDFIDLWKEYGDEVKDRTINEIEHSANCEACEEQVQGFTPIASGAIDTPALEWKTEGSGALKQYRSGRYTILHPYAKAAASKNIPISRKLAVKFEDRTYTQDHGWIGDEKHLGTVPTLQQAKAIAQKHADQRARDQVEEKPIAGGSGICGYGWTCKKEVVEGERACKEHVEVIKLRREIRKQGIPVPATDDLDELRAVLEQKPERVMIIPIAGGSGDELHTFTVKVYEEISAFTILRTQAVNEAEARRNIEEGGEFEWVKYDHITVNERDIHSITHHSQSKPSPLPPIAGGSEEVEQCAKCSQPIEPGQGVVHTAKVDIDDYGRSYSTDPIAEHLDCPTKPRLTTRQRKERRLARREEWADSRARKLSQADEELDQHMKYGMPPMGEPIKVGHHSERRHRNAIKKLDRLMDKRHEHSTVLATHERKANTIAHQLEVSIFDDDADAIEQLQARIDTLEAQRTRIKQINAWFTKHGGIRKRQIPYGAAGDALQPQAEAAIAAAKEPLALTEKELADLDDMRRFSGYLGYAPYALSNLGGNIRRQVKRLERLQKEAGHDRA